jgi:hypothetical protein
LKRNITRARVTGEVSDQPAKASFALAITRSTSAFEASGTRAASAPVVGLKTSPKRPLSPPFAPAADEWKARGPSRARDHGVHGLLFEEEAKGE